MYSNYVFLAAFLIGIISGLRSLTAPAVVAWSVQFHWISLRGTVLAFLGSWPAVAVFTFFAITEYVADKLPRTPPRTAPFGLIARIIFGALSGAALTAAKVVNPGLGAILGVLGGIVGAFAGYQIRARIVRIFPARSFYIAVLEDMVAILGALAIIELLRPV